MREIIKDKNLAADISRSGVAIIDFCSQEIIDELVTVFDQLHPIWTESMKTAYYVSMYGPGKQYYRDVHDALIHILSPLIMNRFENHKVPVAVAQVKGVGKSSSVNIHQDLTIVEEQHYKSYILWIPLENSTDRNGTLSFLEASHNTFRNVRMHTANYMFGDVEDLIMDKSKEYQLSSGEALLFDPATIHFSTANVTDMPRRSIALEIVDTDAPLLLFHHDDSGSDEVDIYQVPDDFWFRYDDFNSERNLAPSFGKKIGATGDVRLHPYTREEVLNFNAQQQ
jgi:hypothetical protein